MQKDIKIGEETIPMRATAATAYRYRQVFRSDLLIELTNKDAPDAAKVETFQRLAYIMAATAAGEDMNALSEAGYLEFLDRFDYMDLIEAMPEVVGLYISSKSNTSQAKKK